MDCGGAVNAVSLSPDFLHAVVGGRDVLKTFSLQEDGSWRESKNLRFGRKKGLDLATTDVKWHPLHSHIVASGSTNGTVLTWDIIKPKQANAQEQQFRHTRTVNRVNWHPTEAHWLITASQDGTVKLWDARCPMPDGSATVYAYAYDPKTTAALRGCAISSGGNTYNPNAEAVRDVQFDPFHPFAFAAALEDGSVQIWDVRQLYHPQSGFTAHAGLTMCCQWHPTQPDVLATGGRDRLVCIWKTGPSADSFAAALKGASADSLHLPKLDGGAVAIAAIQTIASVSQVCWRGTVAPGRTITAADFVTEVTSKGVKVPPKRTVDLEANAFQLASSAALLDNNCYIWDIRHVYLPAAIFSGHRDVVTGINWFPAPAASSSAPPWLMTAGKDGKCLLHDPQHAERPHKLLRTVSMALSPTDIAWCTQRIARDAYFDIVGAKQSTEAVTSVGNPTFTVFSIDSTVADDIEALLEHRLKRRAQRLARRIVTADVVDMHMAFDDSAHTLALLALQYVMEGASVRDLCEHNASVASSLGLLRIAHVWRTLGVLFGREADLSVKPPPPPAATHALEQANAAAAAALHAQDDTHLSVSHSDVDASLAAASTAEPSLIAVKSTVTRTIPGYITGLLESLAALNPAIAGALMDEDETISLASVEETDADNKQGVKPNVLAETKVVETAAEEAPSSALLDMETYAAESWRAFRIAVAMDVLDCYADLADVQTCVTVARVLGPEVEAAVGKRRMQRWVMSYIDLLHRLQLWSPASTVMARANDDVIKSLNQMSTVVDPVCASCTGELQCNAPTDLIPDPDEFDMEDVSGVLFAFDGKYSSPITGLKGSDAVTPTANATQIPGCGPPLHISEVGTLQNTAEDKCHTCTSNLSTCMICLLPVKGMYVWCQGCGHGGHLEHVMEWFTNVSSLCPTGCMHVCNLTVGNRTDVSAVLAENPID